MELGYLQEVKVVIKSLVQSCPNELTVDRLNRDFCDTEGYPIPYRKLGFQSLELFLRFITDTVRVLGYGPVATVRAVQSQKSDHIQNLIRGQKKSARPRRITSKTTSQTSQFSNHTFTYQPQQQRAPSINNYNNNRTTATPVSNNKAVAVVATKGATTEYYNNKNNQPNTTPIYNNKAAAVVPANNKAATNSTYQTASTKLVAQLKSRPPRANNNTGNGCQRATTDGIKQQYSNVRLPLAKSTMPPLSTLHRNNSDYRKPAQGKSLPLTLPRTPKNVFKCAPLPPEVFESDDALFSALSASFEKSAAIGATVEHEPTKSNPQPPGDSTQNHKQSLVSFPMAKPQDGCKKSDFFELSASNDDQLNDMDEAVPKFAANNLVFRLDFPEHTVVFGMKIEQYKLPADIKPGSVMGIFVSEIHNPYKFWFHIHKENHELDVLMHHIERFYKSLEPKVFRIPNVCITPGQVCAAQYKSMWHRAEIIAPIVNNKAKVLFLDYGTVSEVSVDDIKYLASMFASIPTQAIRGCLSHVKPRGLHWSYAATSCFLSLVSELMLYAQVSEIDEVNRAFCMVLCDTNGNEVVQINKTLVEKGFALYDEEWQDFKIKKNGYRWRHLREDFPTFSMIEAGEYPTYFELVDLYNKGIDYELIIDRNIFHPGKLNQHDNLPDAIRNLPFQLLNTNPFRYDIVLQLNCLVPSN